MAVVIPKFGVRGSDHWAISSHWGNWLWLRGLVEEASELKREVETFPKQPPLGLRSQTLRRVGANQHCLLVGVEPLTPSLPPCDRWQGTERPGQRAIRKIPKLENTTCEQFITEWSEVWWGSEASWVETCSWSLHTNLGGGGGGGEREGLAFIYLIHYPHFKT